MSRRGGSKIQVKVGDRVRWKLGGTKLANLVFEVAEIDFSPTGETVKCKLVSGEGFEFSSGFVGKPGDDSVFYVFEINQVEVI